MSLPPSVSENGGASINNPLLHPPPSSPSPSQIGLPPALQYKLTLTQQRMRRKAQLYLRRQAEVRRWLINVTGLELPSGTIEFFNALDDGFVLCTLINKIKGHQAIPSVLRYKAHSFRRIENINSYLEQCRRLGVKETDLFEPLDLMERKNIVKVIQAIISLSELVRDKNLISIQLKRMLRRNAKFSHEEVTYAANTLEKLEAQSGGSRTQPVIMMDEEEGDTSSQPSSQSDSSSSTPSSSSSSSYLTTQFRKIGGGTSSSSSSSLGRSRSMFDEDDEDEDEGEEEDDDGDDTWAPPSPSHYSTSSSATSHLPTTPTSTSSNFYPSSPYTTPTSLRFLSTSSVSSSPLPSSSSTPALELVPEEEEGGGERKGELVDENSIRSLSSSQTSGRGRRRKNFLSFATKDLDLFSLASFQVVWLSSSILSAWIYLYWKVYL